MERDMALQRHEALALAESAGADAASISRFCARHDISRATYYNLRQSGLGPREMRIGTRVLITAEAAAAWRREREAATTSAVA
jgi:hypothetical protein